MKKPPSNNPRLAAIAALSMVLDEQNNLTEILPKQQGLNDRDRSLSRHLTYGVLRWWTALEWLSAQLIKKPLRHKDRDVHRLILMGLMQLWQDNTPHHAVVHETAECARHTGKSWAVGMINAVLRRFQREQTDWLDKLATQDSFHAHPDWLLERIKTDWPESWQDIAAANNQQAPLWVRVNCQGSGQQVVTKQLSERGIQAGSHKFASDALKLTPAANVGDLPGFTEGQFSVQDPAAQLAAGLLDVSAGMNVLDACAAPGGKTGHILERTPGATVTAVDLSNKRLDLIRENLDRLHLDATLIKGDASRPDTWWDKKPYQRILLDAPCSATGVIRRHPEIKQLRQPAQVEQVVKLQNKLLQQLWPLLDAGGILVYATCSILHDENSRQISHFLEQEKSAEEIPIDADWGQRQPFGRQILPGEEEMDGFYYARLRKTS